MHRDHQANSLFCDAIQSRLEVPTAANDNARGYVPFPSNTPISQKRQVTSRLVCRVWSDVRLTFAVISSAHGTGLACDYLNGTCNAQDHARWKRRNHDLNMRSQSSAGEGVVEVGVAPMQFEVKPSLVPTSGRSPLW